jgi:hypothetical protein
MTTLKLLVVTAVVMIAAQPASAQPRTPAEIAECVINESAYYKREMSRAYPELRQDRNDNDPVVRQMLTAAANAIAIKCSVPAK